jgi:hypothetical protein
MPRTDPDHFKFSQKSTCLTRCRFTPYVRARGPFYRSEDERILVTSRKYPDCASHRFVRT